MAPLSFLAGCLSLLAASAVPVRAPGLLLASRAHGALAGCLLAASAVPARAAEMLLVSCGAATRAHGALAGCLLAAASAVPARAAEMLLASLGSATRAHGALAGCLLVAASAVPARAAGLLLVSLGSAMRAQGALAGCLLAASAVPACAAGLLLASRGRGSATRPHRAMAVASLGCLLLFAACAVPARADRSDFSPYADPYVDEGTMYAIATALGADHALGWTNNTSPCVDGWTGVACNRRGRVSEIRVPHAGLNGTLPTEIRQLIALRVLDLRDNALTGDIPDVVFLDLMNLQLDGNIFTSVPVGFLGAARALQVFSISNSTMLREWKLPNDPHRLGTLRAFTADHAQVSGTLSGFLGNASSFPSLGKLSLANNELTGEVPAAFASQTLTHLDLSYNFLTGPVNFIANLTELVVLRLDGNRFTGPLPDFSAHWSLTVVNLAHNRLTGVVPASLVQLGDLSSVSIKDNLFQGALPEFAGSVHSDIQEAALDESFCRPEPGPCDKQVESFLAIARALHFPEAFASSWKGNSPCDGWLGVYCDKNGAITGVNFCRLGLNGTLHPAFGDLKSLVMIILSGNNLTGNVPRSIATLPSLRMLDVSDNLLSGNMPTFCSGVTIWAGGNKNLTVAGASRPCISDPMRRFAAAAAAAIAVLVLA